MIGSFIARYLQLLEAHPVRTKAVSGFLIFSSADVAAQAYEHFSEHRNYIDSEGKTNRRVKASELPSVGVLNHIKPFRWDYKRTLRIATFGLGISLWLHFWWGLLERNVEKYLISASTSYYGNSLTKVVLDQLAGSVIFNVAFVGSQTLLEGKGFQRAAENVKERVPGILKLHYCFWPWVHCFNFSFVSLHRRILVHNVLTVGWMAFLSNRNRNFKLQNAKSTE